MRKKVPENIYIVDESMYFASRLAPKWNFFVTRKDGGYGNIGCGVSKGGIQN